MTLFTLVQDVPRGNVCVLRCVRTCIIVMIQAQIFYDYVADKFGASQDVKVYLISFYERFRCVPTHTLCAGNRRYVVLRISVESYV